MNINKILYIGIFLLLIPTFIRFSYADTNSTVFGKATAIEAAYPANNDWPLFISGAYGYLIGFGSYPVDALMQFDISTLQNYTITGASIKTKVYTNWAGSPCLNGYVYFYESNSWPDINTVTWGTAPAYDATNKIARFDLAANCTPRWITASNNGTKLVDLINSKIALHQNTIYFRLTGSFASTEGAWFWQNYTKDFPLNLSITYAPLVISTLQGKLCGDLVETNPNNTQVNKLTSIMCVGDFQTGAIINRTGFVIHNYTNPFMSAWATLSIYMGSDSAQISNEHPLKLVWQKTYEVKNNTNNRVVEYYPNLFVPDHNFVAVAFSSTEDIGMNTTVNPNTQYIVNQYAPTTVSFLQSTTKKAMFYAYWYRQNVTFAGDNAFAVETTSFIPIPSQIQAFWISVGMPPQAGGFIILIAGIIMLAIVVLTKGVDEPEKVIGILGITAILCASAVNLIPVEIGIAVMIFVAAYFAMKIYSRMAGGSGE